ncbi:hypothetical protein PoB_003748900 [Plakobranchus ocellatus]|uniref:Uncharacterized protein n=1 Tax=Plakobranchus ocellatus TaxID=259542 RepID=A0AAV4AT56_9GAST|nr:hypothetical protein PoB_003748900 [Plakobranchus ocellatus]
MSIFFVVASVPLEYLSITIQWIDSCMDRSSVFLNPTDIVFSIFNCCNNNDGDDGDDDDDDDGDDDDDDGDDDDDDGDGDGTG